MKLKLAQRPATERELIRRAQRGDAAAFAELYNQNKRRVYSLCCRMINNRAQAEELTQDTFLQVYRKLKTFRGDSAFSTWLHRIAVNVVLMHVRRLKSRASEVPLDQPLESQEEMAPREQFGAP